METNGKYIEEAVQAVLKGLALKLDFEELDEEGIKASMDMKVQAYRSAKDLLFKWQSSPDRPNYNKIRSYVDRMIVSGEDVVNELQEELGRQINYDVLEPKKQVQAVKVKNIVLNNIYKLSEDISVLKAQLENDQFTLEEREFKLGYPERFAKGEFFPASKYHNEWHNKEEDAVMICPHGTKGEIIELDGLRIQLPKPPKRKEILFSDEKKKDQYWRRTPLPDGCTPDNAPVFTEYILEEFRRRREGVWFMNNGIPVYLTGSMYFALQWGKMRDNGGYMDFRYAQRDIFYFAEAVIRDPRAMGMHFTKARRTGFTYIILFIMLNHATSTKNANFGMTSQSEDDAQKAFQKLAYGFRNLPFFFRPVVKGAFSSDKILEFALPDDKSKQKKLAQEYTGDDYLNTIIDYESTKDAAYDGQKMKMYLGDESGKWKKPANYLNHWGRISPTFDEGGEIVGKAFIGSTVNPMNQGGEEFKQLCYQSLIKDRDEVTERTPSGLYQHFLPAHKNMNKFTDKYGVCHEVIPEGTTFVNASGIEQKMGSVKFLEARRKAKKAKDAISYNEELRANPMTLEEAMRDEAVSALFDLEKIEQQSQYLEREIILNQHITVGNFEWKSGQRFTSVVFVPNPNGKFKVSWLPPARLQNNVTLSSGQKYPGNAHLGCFGCDSFDISGTTTGKGSKGSIHGVTGFSMEEGVPSNHFFVEYINRTGYAEEFYEDVLKVIHFYGMPILVENNKPRVLYHMKNNGYRPFSLSRPDKSKNKLSRTEIELGGVPSSGKDIIITHASQIENYIRNFVGIYEEEDESKRIREYGSMGEFYFLETLKDWRDFDITKREKHDASISSGYALMGLNRAQLSPEPEIKPINMGLTRYNNKGVQSTLLDDKS